ncbi:MAG: hypothetical protein ACD_78C00010G0005 [uncultured bacterium (gcode 4)]|uniref:Uncharacterized protein n=1 Tax=uncultured bacterium (gcode 4) TaxID=1234023 RepID=K1YYR4_9BACT|nr:MAG: hypothetical protein ACD_78C00010G0005 [uncultured bacterium (gcode 4)]
MTHKEEILTDSYREFVNSRSLYQLHLELRSLENTRDFNLLEAERKMWLVRKKIGILLEREPKNSLQCPEWSCCCDSNYLIGTSLIFP